METRMRADVGTRAVVGARTIVFMTAFLAACSSDARVFAPQVETPSTGGVTTSARPFFGGVYLGDDVSTPEKVQAAIANYTSLAGRAPALVKTFHNLGAD